MAGKRRRVDIEKIDDVNKRMVTFSKRRKGLFKKASELCMLCDANIAIIVFSPAGKPFVFGHPQADAVIGRYLGRPVEQPPQPPLLIGGDDEIEQSRFWWDSVDPERVNDAEELRSMVRELEKARAKVLARADELASASSASASQSSCDTVLAAPADQGFSTMPGEDEHDEFHDWLSPLNLDCNIVSPSEYETIATAAADQGLPTTAGEDGYDEVFDGLSPLNDRYTQLPWADWDPWLTESIL